MDQLFSGVQCLTGDVKVVILVQLPGVCPGNYMYALGKVGLLKATWTPSACEGSQVWQ